MSDKILIATDAIFDTVVLDAKGPVLVDFWAEWCSPCRQLMPIIEDISETYQGDATICKVNADENPDICARFSVRGLPTMILFVNGEEKERLLGLTSKTRIADAIERYLEN